METHPRRMRPLRAAPHEPRRIDALDGIRGLAVAAVLGYHLNEGSFPGGFLGVDIFFVLSGYLITSLLVSEWERRGEVSLGRFWIRRARRLLPLLLLTIAGVAVLTPALFSDAAGRIRGECFAALAQGSNWFEAFADRSYFEEIGRASPLRHLWSLGIEAQFYLVWPLVAVLVLRRGGHRRLATVAGVTAVASFAVMALAYRTGHDPSRLYYGTDTRIGTLLVGAVVGVLRPGELFTSSFRRRARGVGDAAGLAALVGLFVMVLNVGGTSSFVYRGGFLVAALLSAVVILAATRTQSLLAGALSTGALRWLGTRSYAIYLWHWPVIVGTQPGSDFALEGRPLLVFRLVVTAALAELSTQLVDVALRPPTWERGRLRRRLALASVVLVVPAVGVAAATTPPSSESIIVSPTTMLAPTTSTTATTVPVPLPVAPELTTTTVPPAPVELRGVAVGESVLLAAGGDVQRAVGPGTLVNAAISRQPKDVLDALEGERNAGHLNGINVLVVQMGTNGKIEPQDVERLAALASGIPRVVAVSVWVHKPWMEASNAALQDAGNRFPWLRLADWYGEASKHPEWLASDGVHPNREGARHYGDLIGAAARAP
jgi:peptidoglycan/LPS O-acetylase OafA/YrhL